MAVGTSSNGGIEREVCTLSNVGMGLRISCKLGGFGVIQAVNGLSSTSMTGAAPHEVIRKSKNPLSIAGQGILSFFFYEWVRLNPLQLFTSCTPIWSAKVCTPIFLEWEAVHSNIFGVDTFPLQNF
jgi:hypothetical protein